MRHSSIPALADDAIELDRNAYNAAFYELGLRWYWDIDTYQSLLAVPEQQRVQVYLERHQPHLLRAYDAAFLGQAIDTQRTRLVSNASPAGQRRPSFNWAEALQGQLGA